MATGHVPKKRKLEDKNLHSNIFRAKEENLWFDDGNIVIVAEYTPFLVHKSVLSAKSEIFRDTFSIPQPQIPAETDALDGIPILRLSDRWSDVRMMYHSERYLGSKEALKFSDIKAFLRLGTKYEVKPLKKEAIRRLRICFPTSHGKYISQRARLSSVIKLKETDVVEVVNLARLYDLPDILPSALYECTLLDPDDLLERSKNSESTLSTSDLVTVFCAQRELAKSDMLFLTEVLLKDCADVCESPDDCPETLRESFYEEWDTLIDDAGQLMSYPHSFDSVLRTACSACNRELQWDYSQHCLKTWCKLGDLFEMMKWPMEVVDAM